MLVHHPFVVKPRVRPAAESDEQVIRALLAEAFALDVPGKDASPALCLQDRWVLEDARGVVATALSVPGSQWFGGVRVGCSHVRSVAVASSARGEGAGRLLMQELLARQRLAGPALSVLFPSVPAPYRKVGYEFAGDRQLLTGSLSQVGRVTGPSPVRISLDQLDEVTACYDRWAVTACGALGRDENWWRDIVLTGGQTYLFAVREGEECTGYVAYRKRSAPGQDLPYYFDIEVQDAAWTTRSAGLALLSLLASHSGLGVALRWPGRVGDLWSRSLPGQAPRVAFAYPWMLRVVDVQRALAERRYPAHLTASVTLSVSDDTLADNVQSYQLDVEGGQGVVRRTTYAGTSLDVAALAALYTGYLTATELANEGRLSASSNTSPAVLDSLFAGPRPMITEMF